MSGARKQAYFKVKHLPLPASLTHDRACLRCHVRILLPVFLSIHLAVRIAAALASPEEARKTLLLTNRGKVMK